jgi:hypothetical protein
VDAPQAGAESGRTFPAYAAALLFGQNVTNEESAIEGDIVENDSAPSAEK